MWLEETEFSIKLGGNTFINVPVIMAYKGEPLFAVSRNESGYLAIDFEVFDATRQKIASIKKNNVYRHHERVHEYALEGTADTLRLIDKITGSIIVDIRKRQAATTELDVNLRTYLPDGRFLDANPNGCTLPGIFLGNNTFKNCGTGIALG
jgi:hypothetical protein